MDVFIGSFASSCAVIMLTCAYIFLEWIWLRPKKLEKFLRQLGFNGNPYTLLYGDLKQIGKATRKAISKPMDKFSNDIGARASPVYYEALQKHGEKCFVWLGQTPAVAIMDPEIVREVMSRNYDFHKPPGSPFDRLVAKGLSSIEEETWAKHRKLINPAFHLHKLKHMVPSFQLSCGEMMSKWEELMVGNEKSCEVDVWPYLETMTGDAISRTAFGSSYEEGRKIFQLQKQQTRRVTEADASLHIPGYRFLPTKVNKRMKETVKEIESTLVGIINKRMKALKEESSMMSNDLLGLLLESNMKEMKEKGNEFGMSMKEVMEECKIFYFAGQETTASLLVWTMILLSKHQDWQARARHEVLQLLGTKPAYDYQQLNHLKIVGMILQEVLRLYPPAVVLPRVARDEGRLLGGVNLPAGVRIVLPLVLLHHDCRFWGEDAKEFKPERFSVGVGKKAYFLFGWGPRVCIGQNFAMLEAKIAVAMMLQNYSFQLSPSYAHAPHAVITLQPQHGAHLILTKL